MKVSVNWLKDFVKVNPPLEKLAEDLTLAGLEVKKVEAVDGGKDHLLDIEITSNRPDWLSHLGVAREISAVQNLSFKQVEAPKAVNRPMPQGWKIQLKDIESCPYYTGVYIEGIQNFTTPDFIKERLAACGLRPIHVVVDITNYVLFEMGQPLHAFDADLLSSPEIIIRRAKPEEAFVAINAQEYKLTSQDLVIADNVKPLAIAGVMGGKDSEVSSRTRNIFLESAFFNPRSVRQTSRKLFLSSDSSYRFERRVDPEGVDLGRDRAVALIQQYAKPRFISAVIKAGQKPVSSKTIFHLGVNETSKKLGTVIRSHQIGSILTRLGFDVKQDSQDSVKVCVPSFRADILENADLIEEVARIHGFDKIPETLPCREPVLGKPHSLYRLEDAARAFFSQSGCFETVTFSLISAYGLNEDRDLHQAVFVNNPQNQELCWMRPFLLPSLLQVVQKNLSWQAPSIPLFEIANLYHLGNDQLLAERRHLGVMLTGALRMKSWADEKRDYTFYDLKGMIAAFFLRCGILNAEFVYAENTHYLRPVCEEIFIGGKKVGVMGQVHPKLAKLWDIEQPVYAAEINLETTSDLAQNKKVFADIPKFPSIDRDLSVQVAEGVASGTILEDLQELGKGIVTKVEVFDVFRGGRIPKGFKNLSFRLTYQSMDRTLVSDEVQKKHNDIAAQIVKKYQASFQS